MLQRFYSLPSTGFTTDNFIQHNSTGKVNILGGDSNNHCEKRSLYGQVSNSEWLPRQSCLNLQIQKNCRTVYWHKER